MLSALDPKVFKVCAVEGIARLLRGRLGTTSLDDMLRGDAGAPAIQYVSQQPPAGRTLGIRFAACGSRPQKLAAHSGHGHYYPSRPFRADGCVREAIDLSMIKNDVRIRYKKPRAPSVTSKSVGLASK